MKLLIFISSGVLSVVSEDRETTFAEICLDSREPHRDPGTLLLFSEGTVLCVGRGRTGPYGITRDTSGPANVVVQRMPSQDRDDGDSATIEYDRLRWFTFADAIQVLRAEHSSEAGADAT